MLCSMNFRRGSVRIRCGSSSAERIVVNWLCQIYLILVFGDRWRISARHTFYPDVSYFFCPAVKILGRIELICSILHCIHRTHCV